MGKKAKERLYTDTPPKFTPSKLNVSFLECAAARAKSRTGLKWRYEAISLEDELILRLTFKGGKTHIENRKNKHRCN